MHLILLSSLPSSSGARLHSIVSNAPQCGHLYDAAFIAISIPRLQAQHVSGEHFGSPLRAGCLSRNYWILGHGITRQLALAGGSSFCPRSPRCNSFLLAAPEADGPTL